MTALLQAAARHEIAPKYVRQLLAAGLASHGQSPSEQGFD